MGKILILLVLHLIADFLLQGSGLSKRKESKILYLFIHVGIYTLLFAILSPLLLSLTIVQGLIFSGINGFSHLIIDFFSSKLKHKYWQKNESVYVLLITLDFVLHMAILLSTYIYLFPEAFHAVSSLD